MIHPQPKVLEAMYPAVGGIEVGIFSLHNVLVTIYVHLKYIIAPIITV